MSRNKEFLPRGNPEDNNFRIINGDGPTAEELNQLRRKLLIKAYMQDIPVEIARAIARLKAVFLISPNYVGRVKMMSREDIFNEKVRRTKSNLQKKN